MNNPESEVQTKPVWREKKVNPTQGADSMTAQERLDILQSWLRSALAFGGCFIVGVGVASGKWDMATFGGVLYLICRKEKP